MISEFIDFDETQPAPRIRLRNYQTAAMKAVRENWSKHSRQLLDMATGTGKTSIFSAIAAESWGNGVRSLVLENRDALVRQTAKRIKDETGLEAEIEMAGEHASPFAPIVVASVQTLCRNTRLTSFDENHFGLVIADESHHSLATSWATVLKYFHYGASSLADGWETPAAGTYAPKARVLGVTATPELASNRNLGEFYQTVAYQYQLIHAVRDGWLVPLVAKSLPLKIDIRGLRTGRTPNGSDFKLEDLTKKLEPVIEALAEQICDHAYNRKSIAFLPSVKCAQMLAEAVTRHGLRGIFVSGACLDVDEKTEAFRQAGPGTVLCNACLYVEGADFPDVDCVICSRATKSPGFYRQQVGRGTRILPGVVDGLDTPEARKAAIAASAKRDLLILDPFWIHDRIDICNAYDLFTDKPEVKKAMEKAGDLSPEGALRAERDFIEMLEKEARRHARKKGRVIDPLKWAVSLGDETLAGYKPETAADARPPTNGQIALLERYDIDTTNVTTLGFAHRLISRLITRTKLGLATPKQLTMLRALGLDDDLASTLTFSDASNVITNRAGKLRTG